MTVSIEAIKTAMPFEAVLADAGVHLNHGKAQCPFHEDKTPSFTVKGGRGRCWAGCFSGDIIDFAKMYHGLDTKGAINMLADRAGIKRGPLTPPERQAATQAKRERERKAELVRAFRAWEQTTVNEMAAMLRAYRHMKATRKSFSEAELVALAEVQGEVDVLEYHYGILAGRDDEGKYELYKEMRDDGF